MATVGRYNILKVLRETGADISWMVRNLEIFYFRGNMHLQE